MSYDITKLHWLNRNDSLPVGITWGAPWKQGKLQRDQTISMKDSNGNQIPVQSWPTAFWPDGSIKWTAHATVLPKDKNDNYVLQPLQKSAEYQVEESNSILNSDALRVIRGEEYIEVDTGSASFRLNLRGTSIVEQICNQGKIVVEAQN